MKLLRRRNDMANFKSIELNSLDRKFFNSAMKTSVLTKVEEKKLAENWAFSGDKKSMHKIIRAYSYFLEGTNEICSLPDTSES